MIYIFDDIDGFGDNLFERLIATLPEDVQAKCNRFKQMIDKKLSLLGYCVLRFAMEKECGVKEFGISVSESGKPFFSDDMLPFFNISHCKSGVVVALHSQEVGIDIEEKGSYSPELAQYVMSPNEVAWIEQSEDKQTAFTTLWTKKEAYYKCIGTGLKDDIKNALLNVPKCMSFLSFSEHKDYVISICAKNLDRLCVKPIKVKVNDLL